MCLMNGHQKKKSIDNVFGDFLVNKGLYDEIEIAKDNIFELADLVGGHVKIDIYCPKCGEIRVFSCETIPYYWYDEHNQEIKGCVSWQEIKNMDGTRFVGVPETPWTWTNDSIENDTRLMVFKFFCAMHNTHHLDYIVLTYGNNMKKLVNILLLQICHSLN